MRKLFGPLVLCGLLLGATVFAQSPTPQDKIEMQDPPKKQFGSGTKPKPPDTKPPKKTFGSGDKPKPHDDTKPPPKKTFGSGNPPPATDKDKDPPKKTFGSGNPPPATSKDNSPPPSTGPPKKSFGSGTPPAKGPDVGSKPKTPPKFDSLPAQEQRKAESRAAFNKGNTPATSYKDPKGNTVQIDPKDVKIQQLRSQLSDEKWKNRELRERNFYATYYSRPVVVYHDPYSSFFWYWMLDRSIEQQALWAYNCRYSMDAARYNDLMSRNAELAARVRALEAAGAVRNPSYQPSGMTDSDLMYSDEYVNAAYNPQGPPVVATRPGQPVDAGPVLKVLLCIFLGLAIIALVVWLVFVKKW